MENDTLSDTLKMGWDLPLAVGSGGWLEGGRKCVLIYVGHFYKIIALCLSCCTVDRRRARLGEKKALVKVFLVIRGEACGKCEDSRLGSNCSPPTRTSLVLCSETKRYKWEVGSHFAILCQAPPRH